MLAAYGEKAELLVRGVGLHLWMWKEENLEAVASLGGSEGRSEERTELRRRENGLRRARLSGGRGSKLCSSDINSGATRQREEGRTVTFLEDPCDSRM